MRASETRRQLEEPSQLMPSAVAWATKAMTEAIIEVFILVRMIEEYW